VSEVNRQADAYRTAGVDIAEADAGLRNIVRRITATWPPGGPAGGIGAVQLPIGYFANVIDIGGGIGLGICTDGVGSKAIVAEAVAEFGNEIAHRQPCLVEQDAARERIAVAVEAIAGEADHSVAGPDGVADDDPVERHQAHRRADQIETTDDVAQLRDLAAGD
jgi:hypothetical protein